MDALAVLQSGVQELREQARLGTLAREEVPSFSATQTPALCPQPQPPPLARSGPRTQHGTREAAGAALQDGARLRR